MKKIKVYLLKNKKIFPKKIFKLFKYFFNFIFLVLFSFLSISILTLFFTQKIFACNLSIIPSSGEYNVGDEITLKVERVQTCGRCVLPLSETKFNVINAKIVEISNWSKDGIKDVIYVKIKFIEAGEAKFEVIRACSKNYNIAKATFTIKNSKTADIEKNKETTSETNSQTASISTSTLPKSTSSTNSTSNQKASSTSLTSLDQPLSSVEISSISKENESSTTNLESSETQNYNGENAENEEKLEAKDNNNSLLNYIKTNSSYFIISFFLLAGLISYLLKLQFLRNILLLFGIIFLGFYLGGCPCIVGTTFNIFNIKNANIIYLILLSFIPILTSFIWGRWFCGWFCPIGAFQNLLYSIKIKNPKNILYKINNFFTKNDKILKYTKIFVFGIFGYLYISKGYNIFCQYEPFKAIFAFNGSLTSITIAFIIFTLSTINQRFFCKYLCPFGGILKITSIFSLKKIKIDSKCCTGCKLCTKDVCPTDSIKCDDKNNKIVIDHSECIRCLKCLNTCKTKAYKV